MGIRLRDSGKKEEFLENPESGRLNPEALFFSLNLLKK